MDNTIIVALIAFCGTALGSVSGVLASNKLVRHRLEQLEIKVDKHNRLVERMAVVERDMKTAFRLLDGLK